MPLSKLSELRTAAVAVAVLCVGGAAAAPAQANSDSAQAYACHYSDDGDYEYAGHYSGMSTVPSRTGVSSAGIEAQCLLKHSGYSPGVIDGIFGKNSRDAMETFQIEMNLNFDAGLTEDGMPGPNSWPWLRWFAAP